MGNSKGRTEQIAASARELVAGNPDASRADLASVLAALSGCHIVTARRHVRRALIGEGISPRWGGARPNSGPKVGSKRLTNSAT